MWPPPGAVPCSILLSIGFARSDGTPPSLGVKRSVPCVCLLQAANMIRHIVDAHNKVRLPLAKTFGLVVGNGRLPRYKVQARIGHSGLPVT